MSTVNLRDDAKRIVVDFARDRDCSETQAASELVIRGAGQTPSASLVAGLDAAAELFLARLPVTMVELIREVAKDRGTAPAAYLLSYAKLAYDRGETAVLIAEPDAESLKQPALPAPGTTAVCVHCGHSFVPERVGQRFCPEPAEGLSCGRQALLAELHTRRAQRLGGRPAPLAAPPAR